MDFNEAFRESLRHEGGFANHPQDPGGATNKGVTLANFRKYVKPKGTVEDLKNITDEQLETFYRKHFWNTIMGDQLPSGIDFMVYDFAIHSGPSRAVKHLQTALGVTADGVVGPKTLAAANAANRKEVILKISASRQKFLEGLAIFKTFGKGWTRRVKEATEFALARTDEPVKETNEIETEGSPWRLLLEIVLRLLGLR
jgi:lysozyme family protein